MIDIFFLAGRMSLLAFRLSLPLRIIAVFLLLASTDVAGQIYCDCPKPTTCAPCAGGFTKMTLKYNGSIQAHVRIKDGGVVIADRFMYESMTIDLEGTLPTGKFAGSVDVYFVGIIDLLEIYHTSFQTSCNSQYPGNSSGSGLFTITSITSKDGGPVCCAPGTNDDKKPVIPSMPDIDKTLPSTSTSCSMQVDWAIPTPTDNCGVVSLISDYKPNDYFPVATTTVTYTALDAYGNQSTRQFKVKVVDEIPPKISGPSEIKVSADDTSCEATVLPQSKLTISDNCGIKEVTSDHASDIYKIGSKLVKYTATDLYGNKATWLITVTVEDKTKPVFVSRPADIFATAGNSCKAKVSWENPKVIDNCTTEPQLTSDYDKDDEFPVGVTTVKYTVIDDAGNSDTCTFRVAISNQTDPTIENCPKNVTVNAAPKSDSTIATWEEPTATVQCDTVIVGKSHEPGSKFAIGVTPVTYTFTDVTGKSSICEFDVQVLAPDELFAISNVVTPDGDGINDVWKLTNIENFKSNSVVVIDRWGNKIFQATGYDNVKTVWNGTNNNGTIVPTGTYFYTIEVREQGSVVLKKGFIEVIQ